VERSDTIQLLYYRIAKAISVGGSKTARSGGGDPAARGQWGFRVNNFFPKKKKKYAFLGIIWYKFLLKTGFKKAE